MFGNLGGATRRGRRGREKERVGVQSDARAVGIAGDWRVTMSEAGVWTEIYGRTKEREGRRGETSP